MMPPKSFISPISPGRKWRLKQIFSAEKNHSLVVVKLILKLKYLELMLFLCHPALDCRADFAP